MTRKLQNLIEKRNILRGEYWITVQGNDLERIKYLESEIDRLHLLIVALETKAMLSQKIKQLEQSIEVGYD